jgi:hypothetical protein
MADSEGNGKVGPHAPGILDVPLIFIGLESPVEKGSIGEQASGGRAGDLVVVGVREGRNGPDQVGKGDLVGVAEPPVDS